MSVVDVTWPQVLAFRMRRQLLDPVGEVEIADVVRRLCGIQAQVMSAGALAVAVRQSDPDPVPDGLAAALGDRQLMRTWAMRGTLHVFDPAEAGAYLALVAATRFWERGSSVRASGVTPGEMDDLVGAVAAILEGRVVSRDQLVAELVERLDRPELEEKLRSGWSSLLKPAAWQGYLCQGPPDGNRVTFARPDAWPGWRGLPDPSDAARLVIPAYLRAFGPATMATFDAWLTRSLSRKPALRGWFAAVDDLVTAVEVEGEPAYALAEDVDELVATIPTGTVRLLPAFDQYVLGPGTAAAEVVPPARRKEVSKAAGWISPVVVAGGRVVGVWVVTGDRIDVRLFGEVLESDPVPHDALDAEAARMAKLLDQQLTLAVTTI
jgi:hypothetical protein